jgi:predicted small secreted protein
MMRKTKRTVAVIAVLLTSLSLAGCDGNVGVGVSVGVPVGNHGYMSVGGTRWR